MPERFESEVYGPELAKRMRDALESAASQVKASPKDVEGTRPLLASAILDSVDAGVRDHDELVAQAVATLATAKNVSGERFRLKSTKSFPDVRPWKR